MNRPKCERRNQHWPDRQTGRPHACLGVADSPEAGSPAPGSVAGYPHRAPSLPAAAADGRKDRAGK